MQKIMQKTGILKKTIVSGQWMTLDIFIQKIISISTFFVLARLLTPEDFGIMSIVLITPPLLNLFLQINFEDALLQQEPDPTPYFNAIWTVNVLRSFAIFVIIFLIGPSLASFFHIQHAELAIRLGGLYVLIQGFGNVAQLMFFREINFKKIFIRDMASQITYATISIILALRMHSYWALFWANTGLYTAGSISTYILHEYRPKFSLHFNQLKHLVGYGKWIYGQNIVSQIFSTVEDSIIGRLFGTKEVGLYSKARALAITPVAPLLSLVNKIGFPAYSRIQNSSEKAKDGFMKSLDILMVISIPFFILVLVAAQKLVLSILGPAWVELATLFKIFTFAIVMQIISSISAPLFNAVGYQKFLFKLGISNSFILITLLLVLTPIYGPVGAALAISITNAITSILSFIKLKQIINIKLKEIIKIMQIPLIFSVIGLIIGIKLNIMFLSNIYFLTTLVIIGLLYLVAIFLIGVLFKTGPYKTIKVIMLESGISFLL